MTRRLLRCLADDRAATAVEYSLVGALIAVAIVVAVTALSTGLSDAYGMLRDRIGASVRSG
ncbi:Flp family type IVb pilin [Prosthecodimorpha staleyi]|uniref:Flp family type IVb pilin n=1 Tax=Prosthecodimorpha staleyi TaxID=2840188 RepID=A0A947GED1_9HYPH|nr:Flp family type IVb pilin [Prosthecodimorpha staleyi]MBT9291276.1 Flp family type IVb pilin [Prosthecodimorpha staleyi]